MKVNIIQSFFSTQYSEADSIFNWTMESLDKCDSSDDIIVLPEYSDIPVIVKTKEKLMECYEKYSKSLHKKASETAKKCNAVLFMGGLYPSEKGLRNTTVAYNRQGKIVGKYYKQHLVPKETGFYGLDSEYTFESEIPYMIEIDGVKYAFLICYDAYFYEMYSYIGKFNPDVIVACAHQRSDSHHILETMNEFLAYNTNAYVLRASVSMGEDSEKGGSSMIVSPEGIVLVNAKSKIGNITCDIDPHKRFLKPAGYGNPLAPHHLYIEKGRKPMKYRPAGPFVCKNNDVMPYPRICAYRGFNTVAPENTLPAFGLAVAIGANEIEFELSKTCDGKIVVHNSEMKKNCNGFIEENHFEYIRSLDFGSWFDEKYKGLKISTFEEVLQKFACHTIMNIHLDSIYANEKGFDETALKEIISLVRKYDCERYVYFMSGSPLILQQLERLAPDLEKCAGVDENPNSDIVEKAIKYNCKKVQLFKSYFDKNPDNFCVNQIKKAHENGIRVNLFYCDETKEAEKYIEMGVDTILTNDYLKLSEILK